MRFFSPLLILALSASCLHSHTGVAQVVEAPCPAISIEASERITLNTTERRLVCGDEESEAYRVIPLFQAQFLLEGMLQSRGYHHVEFERSADQLKVLAGARTRLSSLSIEADSNIGTDRGELERQVRRFFTNQPVTPRLLDEIEVFIGAQLRQIGLACFSINSRFIIDRSHLEISIQSSGQSSFGTLKLNNLEEIEEQLDPTIFQRFHPFSAHELFDSRKLDLYRLRLIRSGVVQGTYFQTRCTDDQTQITQGLILGPPRVLRFGVGVNTEVGPIARARWANQRRGRRAGRLEADLQASLKEQSLTLTSTEYLWQQRPRHGLRSRLKTTRTDMNDFTEIETRFGPHLITSAEEKHAGWQLSLGPTLIYGEAKFDELKSRVRQTTGALEFALSRTTHLYELFDLHPEAGNQLTLNLDYRHPALGFDEELLKIESSWVGLARLNEWGTGHLVGGIRLLGATTWTRENLSIIDLPPSLKFYGGGLNDIRGHQLNTLPKNQGAGSLSKLALRVELRRTQLFHSSVEGIIFYDEARFGDTSFELNPTRYLSPGLGLRWNSPLGLIQSYFALNRSERPTSDWGRLVFIGFGGTL
jgi:translocation and assembly module TamA